MKKIIFFFVFMSGFFQIKAENGYRLWLRYHLISNSQILEDYRNSINGLMFAGSSPTIEAAKEEMKTGLPGLLGKNIPEVNSINENGFVVIGTPEKLPEELKVGAKEKLKNIDDEGFIIILPEEKKLLSFPGKKISACFTEFLIFYGFFKQIKE
jgi:alpha-glucuronidase